VLKEWTRNQRFVATRNPRYWQRGLPYLDQVEFRPIPEFQARLSALQTGQVDVLFAYGGDSLAALRNAGSEIQVHEITEGAHLENYILLNNATKPFDNKHARLALAHATDVDRINEVLDRGLAQPATGPFSGESAYPKPSHAPKFDLSEAADELTRFRAETGHDLAFDLSVASTARDLQGAELLQDMWKQAGIKVRIKQIDPSQLLLGVLQGKFQAVPWAFDGFPDPDQETVFWSSATAAPVGQFATNFGRFANERLDALMAQARRTPVAAARVSKYAQVAQIIIDEVPWVYETRQVALLAGSSQVQGLGSFPIPGGGTAVEPVQGVIRVTTLSRAR
jgi:peptide/nickel transport system substrate-binding protein